MIGIFAKQPVPGKVKTRLLSHLTPAQAAAVYEASMRDVIALATGVASVTLHYAGKGAARDYFAREFPTLPIRPQPEGDLGVRMGHALGAEFDEGAGTAMILGTDSPTLPLEYLAQAVRLAERNDVVLGPTEDGGYYLVAVRRSVWPAAAAIFDGISWSTATVFDQSLEAVRSAGLTLATLPAWYDIDHAPELRRALDESPPGSHLHRLALADPEIVRRVGGSQR